MKKLLIMLITISMFTITACGCERRKSPVSPPSSLDPIETDASLVWGEDTWADAEWGNE